VTKINLKDKLDIEVKKGIAWSVHAFTASGIVAGFLALVSVLKNEPVEAFMWLGVALFVDGIDGTLARRARVSEYTPNFDGATLDNVIDYFTYVAVPALMIYWFNMVQVPFLFSTDTWSLICAVIVMASSLYCFANVGMKSSDYYFVGFPAIWNVVVLYFYLFNTGWHINLLAVVGLAILTFVPVKFVHPLRVTHWRNVTIPMTVVWAGMAIALVMSGKDNKPADLVYKIELGLFAMSSLYFATISIWRTFVLGDEDETGGATP
jgi:phosphatidylcholine synthase